MNSLAGINLLEKNTRIFENDSTKGFYDIRSVNKYFLIGLLQSNDAGSYRSIVSKTWILQES